MREEIGQPLNFLQDKKIFLDGKIQNLNDLLNRCAGDIDYLVFNSLREFHTFSVGMRSIGFRSPKVITLEQFRNTPREFSTTLKPNISCSRF
ncbi:MAG: hypothetical protein SR2Q5_00895 [Quinella sp. 2Q5]|nr:hypothetical protein [Quinella sp. 2Q5]